ncbi:MAG: apolipoprotein N-acyltransferase, partial [Comamonadaceae bacterium]
MNARPLPWWAAAALAGVAGLLQAASVAWPGSGQPLWWLQLASLALLVGLVQGATGWKAALGLGWLYATAWLAGTFWWLYISMHDYGGLAAPLAVAAVLGLSAFLGTYYAVAAAVFRALQPAPLVAPVLFAGLWLTAELLRGTWFTGFPWGASGYPHVDGPLAVLAPWIGVYGIAAVAAVFASAVALVARRPRGAWSAFAAPVAG